MEISEEKLRTLASGLMCDCCPCIKDCDESDGKDCTDTIKEWLEKP